MDKRVIVRLVWFVLGVAVLALSQWEPMDDVSELLLIAAGSALGLGGAKRGVTLPEPTPKL